MSNGKHIYGSDGGGTVSITVPSGVTTNTTVTLQDKSGTVARLEDNGGRRNYLINGNFKINQRGYVSGTATTVANQYILDRWYIPTSGQSATFAETNGIVTITAPASGICQKIENISNNGLTRTISYTGTATLTVTESSDNITYTPVTLTGKTFTPTAGKYVKITLSNGTVSLIKDEDRSVATDGWHPYDGEFGGEVQACQRYYWASPKTGATIAQGHYRASTTVAVLSSKLPVSMRVAPSILLPNTTGFNLYGESGAPVPTSFGAFLGTSAEYITFSVTTSASTSGTGVTLSGSSTLSITASAEL